MHMHSVLLAGASVLRTPPASSHFILVTTLCGGWGQGCYFYPHYKVSEHIKFSEKKKFYENKLVMCVMYSFLFYSILF